MTGEIASNAWSIWVNGVEGTNNGDGTWSAQIAAIGVGGGALEALAIPNSDHGGNGSGGSDAAGNPISAQAQGVLALVPAPSGVYISKYQEWNQEDYYDAPNSWSDTNQIIWQDGQPARQANLWHDGAGYVGLDLYTWPATSWPQPLPNGLETQILFYLAPPTNMTPGLQRYCRSIAM